MKNETLKDFDVKFSGLKLGEHLFDFQMDKAFFSFFGHEDFDKANLDGKLKFTKHENRLDLHFSIDGNVTLPCDVTGELFPLPIADEWDLLVKFGDEHNDENEEILIVPQGETELNVAHYFYEMAVLATPLKRVSPEGEKQREREENTEQPNTEPKTTNEIDPRWDKLKELLN